MVRARVHSCMRAGESCVRPSTVVAAVGGAEKCRAVNFWSAVRIRFAVKGPEYARSMDSAWTNPSD